MNHRQIGCVGFAPTCLRRITTRSGATAIGPLCLSTSSSSLRSRASMESPQASKKGDRMTFAQEQQVQRTIAIIQKTHKVSILQIDEVAIRAAIAQGKSPQ